MDLIQNRRICEWMRLFSDHQQTYKIFYIIPWNLLKSAFPDRVDEISGVQLHAETVWMELVDVILRKVRNQFETVDHLYIRILSGDLFHIVAEADEHIIGFGMVASPKRWTCWTNYTISTIFSIKPFWNNKI